jgi:hypothetical protein
MAEKPSNGGPGASKGGVKSVRRLAELNFDPIQQLVETYNKICAEITYQEKRRDGVINEMIPGTERIRSFNIDAYLKLIDQRTTIAEKLLRFGYGRVPETDAPENVEKPLLTINLPGGRKRHIGGGDG